jgi:hypothetical protein
MNYGMSVRADRAKVLDRVNLAFPGSSDSLPAVNVHEAFGSFAAGVPERKTTSKAHIPD